MKVAGVDEAGRGPVIGPMVVAGIVIKEEKIPLLEELGVKDSKELTPSQREEMFDEIISIVDEYSVKIVDPKTIDSYVFNNKLNFLELKKFSEIINELSPDVVYVDSPSKNTKKIEEELRAFVNKNVKIIAENKADAKYPIVSAASIIAKVIRDREVRKIKEKLGIDVGSGYPSDPRTKKALEEYYEELKPYVRESWKTIQRMKEGQQKSLLDFL